MATYKGFAKDDFMEYMEQTFDGFDSSFLRETVENIIEYAHKYEHVSKDQFAEFISSMLPEVTFGEIAMFCEDAILTSNGREQKYSALVKFGLPISDTAAFN